VRLEFFKRSPEDQAAIIREVAARRGLLAVMVEKDFWVSWTLAVLFTHQEFGEQLVFKGGTSLSKVFGVIERFSEDIDLSVSPEFSASASNGWKKLKAETNEQSEWKSWTRRALKKCANGSCLNWSGSPVDRLVIVAIRNFAL